MYDNERIGVRFKNNVYVELIKKDEDLTLITDINGKIETYDVTGGGDVPVLGSGEIDLRNFPKTMTAGDTYTLPISSFSEDAEITIESSAPSSKISVENHTLTCIGNTLGGCGITITIKSSDNNAITLKERIEVI